MSSFIEVMSAYVIFVRNEPGTYEDFLSNPSFEQSWPKTFTYRQEFKDKYWQYHVAQARQDYNIEIQGTTRPSKRSLHEHQADQAVVASGEPPWPHHQHNLDGSYMRAQTVSTPNLANADPAVVRAPPNAQAVRNKRELQ